MCTHRTISILLALAISLFCIAAMALSSDNLQVASTAEFPIPNTYLLVNDNLNLLTVEKSVKINNKLQALERHNGIQIVFLSVPSIGQMEPFDYASKVYAKWDLGHNRQDNGVLFLVCQDGRMFIRVGAGAGGAIPDLKVARIFSEIIKPNFASERYVEGVEAAVDELIKAAKGEDTKPTFLNYFDEAGYYFSSEISSVERFKKALTLERVLVGMLALFGFIYAARLIFIRKKKKRVAN
jgi:uncharacterized membrane protein YgcG